ncbi:MAG: hypothetical protein VYC44_05805 [Chloroflexota bacterium]|nr:hypothetical protein [Chloroflexota bacterium]
MGDWAEDFSEAMGPVEQQYGGGGFGNTGGGGGVAEPKDHVLEYHWAWDIPELQDFIQSWIARLNSDTPPDPHTIEDRFQAELEKQDWWIDHHQAYRDAEQQRVSDPGTWEENLRIEEMNVRKVAEGLGYVGPSALTAVEVTQLAVDSLHAVDGGWLDETLKRHISQLKTKGRDEDYDWSPDSSMTSPAMGPGAVRGSYDSYQALAAANLITVDDDRVWNWAHKFTNKDLTDQQIKQEIYDIGKNQYGFVDEDRWDRWRHSGTTLSDHLADRRVAVGGVWEIGANEVNWDSQFMKDNLIFQDPVTGQERFRTSKELKQLAMRDPDTKEVNPRYAKTLGYKTKKANFRNMIYQGFGVI